MSSSIELSKRAFGLTEWNLDSGTLRPLRASDEPTLHEILSASNEMTWERVAATEAYTHQLLRYRLDHYLRYGFGVYGLIDAGGHLVGQAGLQVLDEIPGEVEAVVFLKAGIIGSGLGSRIMRDLIEVCKRGGLQRLYATVRADNLRALAMVRKAGFEYIQDMVHFGLACEMWRNELGRGECEVGH